MRAMFIVSFMFLFLGFVWSGDEKGGVIEGLLIEKGEKHILVIPDGKKEAVKYIPEWKGGMPKDGGGLEKSTLEKIKKLIVPNRVSLKWKFEEHNRVLDVKILEPKKKGEFKGVITNKGDHWIEVTAEEGDKAIIDRFSPRWLGGAPKNGGGLDKKILETLKEFKVGDKVELDWEYDERKRVIAIEKAD